MNDSPEYLNNSLMKVEHFDLWKFLFEDIADSRTNEWFLIKDPIPPSFILIGYLLFVLKYGPEFMRNKKPFRLKYTLLVYNGMQVMISSFLFLEAVIIWKNYNLKCEPVDYGDSPFALRTARAVHLYYLAKLTELLDTIFFVLRKKDRQITFLHVYHHTAMPVITYAATKYFPGGHGTFIGLLNTFVHIIMYSYYLLAAFGKRFQRFLWWKKYITTLQMIQFCLYFLHNSQLVFFECGYPRWTAIICTPNAAFFFFLFKNFYHKAYRSSKEKFSEKNKDR